MSKLKTSVRVEMEPALAGAEDEVTLPASEITAQPHRRVQWAQAFVLTLFYTIPAIRCFYMAGFADPDVWWHLRSGEWILAHRAVPHTDLFSVFDGKPWSAYSWLFDVTILQLFRGLGLTGLVTYSIGMALIFTVALHRMISRLQSDFMIGVGLLFLAGYCLSPLNMPRSWWFSILFFVIEIDILMQARKTRNARGLLWLPLIFALWANLHIQFIDGLIVLLIACADTTLSSRWIKTESRIRSAELIPIVIACAMATFANPYGWNIYKVAYELATQPGLLNKISEFQSIAFRSRTDFGVLFFALGATVVLSRARQFRFFESALLLFAIVVSFRSQRDAWIVVVAACAVLASELRIRSENRFQLKTPAIAATTLVSGLLVFLAFSALHIGNSRMRELLAERMPTRAVDFVKGKGYGGPLYNDFGWGGYLMWSLRMPVSIDGRAPLYGDDHLDRTLATWAGSPGWASDPYLTRANLVIGPAGAPLIQLLKLDPRFELAYEDKIAAVFVSRKSQPADRQ